jgi:hypothetical protein
MKGVKREWQTIYSVAQTDSLLYRGLAIRPAAIPEYPPLFPISHCSADCQSAIQQITNLRYGSRAPEHRTSTALRSKFGVQCSLFEVPTNPASLDLTTQRSFTNLNSLDLFAPPRLLFALVRQIHVCTSKNPVFQ